MKRKLALFDFDGTMIQGDSITTLVRRFVKDGHMSVPYLFQTLWATLRWKMGKLPVEAAKSMSLSPLNTLDQGRAERYCRDFVTKQLVPRLYRDALAAMQAHHDAGDLVLLVSASPYVYMQYLKEVMPTADIIATPSNQAHLVTVNVIGEEKPRQINQWLSTHEVEADWQNSSAYGDSANDLPMLSMVGHPFLINPTKKTKRRGAGIPVLHWGKNLRDPGVH